QLEADCKIVALIQDGQRVDQLGDGHSGEVILDQTPFYAESGGQVGDTGTLDSANGAAHVKSTKALVKKQTVHFVTMTRGTLKVGDRVHAAVAKEARQSTMNHHTATHLLQAALQQVLGD